MCFVFVSVSTFTAAMFVLRRFCSLFKPTHCSMFYSEIEDIAYI